MHSCAASEHLNFFKVKMLYRAGNVSLSQVDCAKGFYPLCSHCEYNGDCPSFRRACKYHNGNLFWTSWSLSKNSGPLWMLKSRKWKPYSSWCIGSLALVTRGILWQQSEPHWIKTRYGKNYPRSSVLSIWATLAWTLCWLESLSRKSERFTHKLNFGRLSWGIILTCPCA